MSSAAKKDLYELVDKLPDSEVSAARRYLEFLRERGGDPVQQALDAAPIDDEPETAEEAAAVQEARDELAQGKGLTTEQLKRELGL